MTTKKTAVSAAKGRVKGHVNGASTSTEKAPGVKIEPPKGAAQPAKASTAPHAVVKAAKPTGPMKVDSAVFTGAPSEEAQKEIGPKTRIALSIPRLKAALAVAATKDSRPAINGVLLQALGTTLNIVATDGAHMLQSCMWLAKDTGSWPEYLSAGVILERAALAKAVAFLSKMEEVVIRGQVSFEFANNATSGVLMDLHGDARFRIPLIDAQFPAYAPAIQQASSALLGGEFTPLTSTAGIDRAYMKAASQVAAALEAKAVQVVAPTDNAKPWVLVYPGCEGVLHIVMPVKLDVAMGAKTLALIGTTNLKGSLAALKATITMKTRAMEESTSESAKCKHKDVIDSCRARMTAIEAAIADTTPKLAGPKADKPAKVAPVKVSPKARKPRVTAATPKAVH